ncbi:hypothetical protein PCANC_03328 [Puccinia coronata f. sp. avenae]|uniref:Uncharacterized protein n=1 Tax=Puccinia coronata f. sp. avenae TaxID=200324 RepID=A0A2N5T8S3_9BASI|nr:hypothetical protein PCANC_03328 [Puccinia coronata f. sp. avenae]
MARPSTPDEIPTIPNHHATPARLPPPPQIRQSACKKNPTITPGFISTQNDSRQTLTIPADVDNGQNETARLRSSAINKTLSGKNSTQTNPSSSKETTSTPEAEAIYDIIQDSDNENKKAAARSLKSKADRKIAPRKDGTDSVLCYFTQIDESLSYSCFWCLKVVKASNSSYYNLKIHRDGVDYKGTI